MGLSSRLRRRIRLADHGDARHCPAHEFAFHRSECYRLVTADHLGLLVAGWERDQQRRDQPGESSGPQIKSRLGRMQLPQSVKRPDSCHDERAGHERRHLVVGELHPGPGIQQIGAEAAMPSEPSASTR